MLLIVPEFKPTETTLKHLMCFLVFIYGSKRGDLGCISAAQQSMLLKTDVARVRMISMFILFSCAGYSIICKFAGNERNKGHAVKCHII